MDVCVSMIKCITSSVTLRDILAHGIHANVEKQLLILKPVHIMIYVMSNSYSLLKWGFKKTDVLVVDGNNTCLLNKKIG